MIFIEIFLKKHMLNQIKKSKILQLLIIYTRYLIGASFTFAGIVKLRGGRFFTEMDAIKNSGINTIPHLFETLYQSGLYWKFLGLCQIIAAFLLMTQRYSKLGAVVFFPIILNIFIITISYPFGGTPYITSLMLMANILLLIWEWPHLKVLFNQSISNDSFGSAFEKQKIWELGGLCIFIFTIICRTNLYNLNTLMIWVEGSLAIGLICLIFGLKNNH
jgi:uncharacterized membrane protein YphA (DoxX/SURF4 family)